MRGFTDARILVVGDMVMDHFIWGNVNRISPEAPVPVVDVTDETIVLGAAANVAANISELGGRCAVSGVTGIDDDGKRLESIFKERKIPYSGIITTRSRQTTIKTRIIAHQQQVVRFDRETKEEISEPVRKKVFKYLKSAVARADVIIISDYAKGMVTRELVEEVLRLAKGKPVIVDPKVENFDMYAGVSLVTPNNSEASLAAGIDIVDDKSLNRAAAVIKDKLGCEALLITRGEHGMSIFTGGTKKPHSIPTIAREIFDVSGAGDTVVGVFALALAAGADYKEAAVMSNLAAGIVVEKLGTATVDISELKAAVQKRLK